VTGAPALLWGLDIGGTKIGLAVGDDTGRVLAASRLTNDPDTTAESLLESALAGLERLAAEAGASSGPVALGIAAPGPLDPAKGRILEAPNMPHWQHFDLRDFVADRVPCSVALMNDANASVLAEWYWGAARGTDTAVFLTMSTGLGGGLIVGGRLFEGPLGLAGEVGHLRLRDDGPVGFGKRGSVEGYLSGPGLLQVARGEVIAWRQRGERCALTEEADPLTPERLCDLAREGDPAAVAVINHCGHALGCVCAMLVDLLNPDVIVLGTIGTAHADLFIPRARAVIDKEALPAAAAHVDVRPSGLTDRGNQTALAVAKRRLGD
jgi:glucokinase